MSPIDRHHLAAAYCAAWHAVKGPHDRMVVNPEPNGWFEKINTCAGYRLTKKVRASELIKALAVLAGRLERLADSRDDSLLRGTGF